MVAVAEARGKAGPARVVITGAGIITSMGPGWAANAAGFREGRDALRPVTLFDTSRQRVRQAGEVELPAELPPHRLTARRAARVDRATRLLLHAALEAQAQAGWGEREDVPMVLGTSAGAMALGEDYYKQAVATPSNRRGQATRVQQYQTQMQGVLMAEALGLRGPLTIISNACASGANAIAQAFLAVRNRRATAALGGGYDALCQLVFAGFDSLQALSQDRPRPFDAARDGLAIGEGAGIFLLEERATALARGAMILGEIVGCGAATDLHHLTQPHPQGAAAIRSMARACAMAGLAPRDIDYINTHGTGTPLNDVAEAAAIARWAGEDATNIAASSTKGAIGHLLGGAGAVEAVICLMALREGWLPPTRHVRTVDPAVTFDLVQEPRAATVRRALTNSFGFGGANATLILQQAELA